MKPAVSVSPSTASADPGGSVTFTCIVTSSVAYTVTWYKQSSATALSAGSDYSLTATGLIVLNVQQIDVGNYYCRANSSVGQSPASNMGALVCKYNKRPFCSSMSPPWPIG